MLDAARGYLQLVTGLTEVTMRKARDVAQSLLAGDLDAVVPGKDAAADAARSVGTQVQDLADDIVSQATANRELLIGLIRTEVDRAAGRLGFVREEELAAVRRHVQRLEDQLGEVRSQMAGRGRSSASSRTAAKRSAEEAGEEAGEEEEGARGQPDRGAGRRPGEPSDESTPAATAPATAPAARSDEGTT